MADVSGLVLTAEEKEFLQHPALGAVILFNRNFASPEQLHELVAEIKEIRSPDLLIAVDQEGGRVQRFRDQFVRLPALQELGADIDSSPEQALQRAFNGARLMALELRQYDVDFSFAPVLDIANPQSQIIGDRGFHSLPKHIPALAKAYIDGMKSAGMQATGKHFPGHGGVLEDSHLETPIDRRDLDTLRQQDLIPYQHLGNQIAAIMTAHISFPNVDPDLPTFSSFWIQQVLRKEIGFDGLVFSDDLTMKGAEEGGTPIERADKALAAGCDMILICNDPDNARIVAEHLGDRTQVNQTRLQRMQGENAAMQKNEITELASFLNNQSAAVNI